MIERAKSADVWQAWAIITLFSSPLNEDAWFWWETTGTTLAAMMQRAGYDTHLQYQGLLFYYHYLAPALGPQPTADGRQANWESFMTDDHTPIELSWSWTKERAKPIVRLGIEPIGKHAGSRNDSLNTAATYELIEKIRPISPALDLTWFDTLATKLTVLNGTISSDPGEVPGVLTSVSSGEPITALFVAFDLSPTGVVTKAYFFPMQRAMRDRVPRWRLVRAAVAELAAPSALMTRALTTLSVYIQSRPEGQKLTTEIVGIDCVVPAQSRIKIYLRSQETSFSSVRRNITMGGALNGPGIDKGLEELKQLWDLVLGRDSSEEHEELGRLDHRTAGIIYNFELKPTGETPVPKVYIPVRHYALNDQQIATGLATYLARRGDYGFTNESYVQTLQDIL